MSKREDPLVVAIHATEDAHDANVARGATDEELRVSYLACLVAQRALYLDCGDSVIALDAEITRVSR